MARPMSSPKQESDMEAEGGKVLIMVGYRISFLFYMGLGLFSIGCQCKNSIQLPLSCYVAAGPMLAAGVSYVLEGAAVNDRLHTETSQRLNFVLGLHGAAWLCCAYLLRNTPSKIVTSPWILGASAMTLLNSFKALGVMEGKKPQETSIVKGLLAIVGKSMRTLVARKTLAGLVYLGGTIMVGCLKVSELVNIYNLVSGGGAIASTLSKNIFRISFYTTLYAVLLSLKDGGGKSKNTNLNWSI
jgi:hypothetical protein